MTVKFNNRIGLWTLYLREVRRFMKVKLQTIMAPMVTTLLFLAVFSLALGGSTRMISGIPLIEFLAPGLIMMAIAQNAFANTSSSLVVAKVQGNIVDTLMPPFTAHELTLGIALGGATRGMVVGCAVAIGLSLFVDVRISHAGYALYFAFMAALMLSLVGIMGGIWSEKFDHIAGITNFVVTPLSFLSGTFYSIHSLPEMAQLLAKMNPFFYMIDGFRYGFIGQSDASPVVGMAVLAAINTVLWICCTRMFHSGYKLKP